jgi:hypothetical protein
MGLQVDERRECKMLKRLGVAVLCAALAACGGSNAGGSDAGVSNSAAGRTFTYGGPEDYGSQASAMENGLVDALSGNADALGLASLSATRVLGSTGYTSIPPSLAAEARSLAFRAAASPRATSAEVDDPSCYSESGTTATFSNCTITVYGIDYEYDITVNGWISLTQNGEDSGALRWDLDVTNTYAGADGASATIAYRHDGELQASSGRVVGSVLSSISASASTGGNSTRVGFDESVAVDVTLAGSCATFVTNGTLEAKRVWTVRPSADERDAGAKVTWTGCGQATIQRSVP